MKALGAGDYELILKVTDKDGEQFTVSGDKLAGLVYREGIHCPTLECDFGLVDTNDQNFMEKILVGEKVDITFRTKEGADVTVKLVVYGIMAGGRENDKVANIFRCMSEESFRSLYTRIEKLYQEKPPTEIIQDVLTTYLGSSKQVNSGIDAEPLTVAAMRDKPFDFILSICKRSIPTLTSQKGAGKGTAGYTFYETSTGYHLKSMDELLGAESDGGAYAPTTSTIKGEKAIETYFANVAVNADGQSDEDESRVVQSYTVKTNNDLEEQLYKGTQANLVGFFDPNSLRYTEETYILKGENFKAMGHLAKGEGENPNIDNWRETPSRVMTKVFNNEMYEKSAERAEEEKYDKIKQYLAQQIVRNSLGKNQQIEINIPGNSTLHAGDKIILQVYKSVSNAESSKKDRVDKKMSGYYLISKVAHKFDNGMATTSCLLIRDQNNET